MTTDRILRSHLISALVRWKHRWPDKLSRDCTIKQSSLRLSLLFFFELSLIGPLQSQELGEVLSARQALGQIEGGVYISLG
jgi:hypothetical protein